MPSWKKVIVSGSAARISTLFTSGHLTASGNFSGSFQSTGSIGRMELDSLQVTKVIEATASHAIQTVTSSLAQKVDFTRFFKNAFICNRSVEIFISEPSI